MEITYLGHACFRLKNKDASLLTDPFDPEMVGLKLSQASADIVTVSHNHQDHNQWQLVKDVKKVVQGPGEYEILGVSIIGISTFHDNKKGEERGRNTIYIIEMDDLRLVHLGDLGHKLSERILEEIGSVDVLMIPVGGEYTLNSLEAVDVAQSIEASITIPMHYQLPGMNEQIFGKISAVDPFLSEMGLSVERLPKLSLKKSGLSEDQKVVVLEKK